MTSFMNAPLWSQTAKEQPNTIMIGRFYISTVLKKVLKFLLQCNAKCGQGLQHRNVICRDSRGQMNGACSLGHKPVSRQPCTGMSRDCELNGPNSDRQKKGVGITETKKGDSVPGAPSG